MEGQLGDVAERAGVVLVVLQLHLDVPVVLLVALRQQQRILVVPGRPAHADRRLHVKVDLTVFRLTHTACIDLRGYRGAFDFRLLGGF